MTTSFLSDSEGTQNIGLNYTDPAPVDTGCTYSLRIGISGSGTWYFNRAVSSTFGGAMYGGITIQEIL